MPQISIIKKSDIQEARRFDAEFFKPEYLEIEERLKTKNHIYFGDFSFITDGIHASIDFDNKSNILLFSAKAPKQNIFDISGLSHISKKQHSKNPRTALQENDVIISTVGTIGNCAVITKDLLPANSDRHVGIIRPKNISAYFLSTFLLTKYGRMQSSRNIVGNVQPNLYIRDMKKFILPVFSQSLQLQIERIVKEAHQKQTQSKQLYKEAEEMLLKELDLLDYKSENVLSFETTKKETDEAERFDAEYFQPKYEGIIKKIEKYEVLNLSDEKYFKIITGTYTKEYSEEGSPYIRSVNINEDLTISSDNLYKTQEELDSKFIVKTGDIITSRVGSIGTLGFVSEEFNDSFISDNILRIRNIYSKLDSLFLAFYLKKIGTIFMERMQRGSVQQRLNQETLKEFKIPLIKSKIQKQIAKKIQESHKLRKESKELLEEAKRKVEEEIEKGK